MDDQMLGVAAILFGLILLGVAAAIMMLIEIVKDFFE